MPTTFDTQVHCEEVYNEQPEIERCDVEGDVALADYLSKVLRMTEVASGLRPNDANEARPY